MTLSHPSAYLACIRPTSKLFGYRTTLTVLFPFVVFMVFMSVAMLMLQHQPFYHPFDAITVGVPGHEWQKKGDNFESSVVFFFLALQLPTVAFAFTFGSEHRRNILANRCLSAFYLLTVVLFFLLLWGGPSDFHCAFRVNCDSHTSNGMYVPVVQEFSTGNMGGCFLGPQLIDHREDLENSGKKYEVPSDSENECNPHHSLDLTKEIQVPSDALPWLGAAVCRGPHNCFDGHFRMVMSFLLVGMVLTTCVCGKLLASWHPATKHHFKNL